jgi:hypothetical protein
MWLENRESPALSARVGIQVSRILNWSGLLIPEN